MTQHSSRPGVRVALVAGGVMAAAGVLALAAFTVGGEAGTFSGGPRLAIDVVPPVERDVAPGETMDVGDLNDGFDRAALQRQAAIADDTYLPPDAYVGEGWVEVERMPMPTPVDGPGSPMQAYRAVVDRPTVRDALDDGSRSFGFDAPRRDFAAERAARWAAREAAAAPQPAAPSDGAVPYSDVAKYSSE